MASKDIKNRCKELYIKGGEVGEIVLSLKISRATFYYHKKTDFLKGIDWDLSRHATITSVEEIQNKEAIFLNNLISGFDKFMKAAAGKELELDTLKELTASAKIYWSIKAPKVIDEKALKQKVAINLIHSLSSLALEEKNQTVASWLSQNADLIISKIKSVK